MKYILFKVLCNTCTAKQNAQEQADMHAAFILCEKGWVNHDSVIFQLYFFLIVGWKS